MSHIPGTWLSAWHIGWIDLQIKLSSYFGLCYFILVDSSSKESLGKEVTLNWAFWPWGLLLQPVLASGILLGSEQNDWLILWASYWDLSPASELKYLDNWVDFVLWGTISPGGDFQVQSSSRHSDYQFRRRFAGFCVFLFNMKARFFVWGWEKLLWQL